MLSVPYLAQLIRLVLTGIPFPDVERAVPLLLGVAAQESLLRYTRQLGKGPARGYWQMEPVTEREHWNWIKAHPLFESALHERCGVEAASYQALEHNLPYQILMTRLHFYIRDPLALPERTRIQDQAQRWKTYYNTQAGKGTIEEYLNRWQTLIMPYWQP